MPGIDLVTKARLTTDGWIRLRYPTGAELVELGHTLGEPVASRPGGPMVDVLVPSAPSEARKGSLSALHGFRNFPLHTEAAYYRLPPRWVLMRLAQGATSLTPTKLVDHRAMPLPKSLRSDLCREVWLVSGKPGHFLSPIVNDTMYPGTPLIRWDGAAMRPAIGAHEETARHFIALATKAPVIEIRWTKGNVVIWDNWRFLHAREDIDEADVGHRKLERLLVLEKTQRVLP